MINYKEYLVLSSMWSKRIKYDTIYKIISSNKQVFNIDDYPRGAFIHMFIKSLEDRGYIDVTTFIDTDYKQGLFELTEIGRDVVSEYENKVIIPQQVHKESEKANNLSKISILISSILGGLSLLISIASIILSIFGLI